MQDCHIEKVQFDPNFWSEIVSKCLQFFEEVLLPEIIFKYCTELGQETKGDDNDEGSCYWGGSSENDGGVTKCRLQRKIFSPCMH